MKGEGTVVKVHTSTDDVGDGYKTSYQNKWCGGLVRKVFTKTDDVGDGFKISHHNR